MVKIGILSEGQKEDMRAVLVDAAARQGIDVEIIFVEHGKDFAPLDALVLPRGKSLRFGEIFGGTPLGRAIVEFSKDMPMLAICGSMIACVERFGRGCEGRNTIGIIDAKVDNGCLDGNLKVVLANGQECIGNFTEAPVLSDLGRNVEKIATCKGKIVALKDGNVFGFSYVDFSGRSYEQFLQAVGRR